MDLRFWRRCFCCRSNKDVDRVYSCSWPGEGFYRYYHDTCLVAVLSNPPGFPSHIIGQAVSIVDQFKEDARRRQVEVKSGRDAMKTMECK